MSERIIRKVYQKMTVIIIKYLKIYYQSEPLELNWPAQFYAVDESLINYFNGNQVWLIGNWNNEMKEFRIEASCERESQTLKAFIYTYAKRGSFVITDGWQGYSFLHIPNLGYTRISPIHVGGTSAMLRISTSHIENISEKYKVR